MRTEATRCVVCEGEESTVVASGRDYLHETTPQIFTFVECTICRHIYLNPRPAISEISALYPKEYVTFNKTDGLLSKLRDYVLMLRFKAFAEHVPQLETARMLDIGCGDVGFLAAIRRCYPRTDLSGLDWHFGPEVEAEAHSNRIETITGAIEHIDLPQNHFDIIVINQLIEHVWDVDLVVERCHGALKAGGVVAIETPNPDGWDRRFFKSGGWGGYYWPRHLNLFSRPNLKRVVERAGFRTVMETDLLAPPCWIYSMQFSGKRRGAEWVKSVVPDNSVVWLGGFAAIDKVAKALGATTSNQKLVAAKL